MHNYIGLKCSRKPSFFPCEINNILAITVCVVIYILKINAMTTTRSKYSAFFIFFFFSAISRVSFCLLGIITSRHILIQNKCRVVVIATDVIYAEFNFTLN